MSAPEFSRPVRIDTIGDAARSIAISADAEERAALATRFGLRSLDRLDATLAIRREAGGVLVTGRVTAQAEQICVVTGETVPAAIDEQIALRFVPEDAPIAEDEIELGADALDTLPFDGGAVDLGEAAAETMALALDPYPRAPGADDVLRAAGVVSEEEAGPFGALASLRDRLRG